MKILKTLLIALALIATPVFAQTAQIGEGGTGRASWNVGALPYYISGGAFSQSTNYTYDGITFVVAGTGGRQTQIGGTASTCAITTSDGFGSFCASAGFASAYASWDGGGGLNFAGNDYDISTSGLYPSLFNGNTYIKTLFASSTTITSLTIRRVPYASTNGLLVDSSGFQYGSLVNTLSVSNLYNAGNEGIGTSTSVAKLSLANSAGVSTPAFLVSTTTAGNATSTAFIIDSNGKVGVSTTSPSKDLSVNGGLDVTGEITFERGLKVISSTTGNFVGIGTSTSFGASGTNSDGGLQMHTVDPYLYQVGNSIVCDMPQAADEPHQFLTGVTSGNITFGIEQPYKFATTSFCGLVFVNSGLTNTVEGLGSTFSVTANTGVLIFPSSTPFTGIRLQAGAPNVSGALTAGSLAALESLGTIGDAGTKPVMIVKARATQSATSTGLNFIGFQTGAVGGTNNVFQYSTVIGTSTSPNGQIGFYESTSTNPATWLIRNASKTGVGGGTDTLVDTGVVVKSGNDAAMQKLVIEVGVPTASSTTFLIDGQNVGVLSSTSPSGALYVKMATTQTASGAIGKSSLDIGGYRIYQNGSFWWSK